MMEHAEPRVRGRRAKASTDRGTIMRWVTERGGRPARVKSLREEDSNRKGKLGGLLRIDFLGSSWSLEPISWEDFFAVFDENHFIFLYQDKEADGMESKFYSIISKVEDEGARTEVRDPARGDITKGIVESALDDADS